jgi:hypothetical protein
VELTSEVDLSLASTNPFAVFSWPEDALPISLTILGMLGYVVLRRRAVVRQRAERPRTLGRL